MKPHTVYVAKKVGGSVKTMKADWAALSILKVMKCSFASKNRSLPNCLKHMSKDLKTLMLSSFREASSVNMKSNSSLLLPSTPTCSELTGLPGQEGRELCPNYLETPLRTDPILLWPCFTITCKEDPSARFVQKKSASRVSRGCMPSSPPPPRASTSAAPAPISTSLHFRPRSQWPRVDSLNLPVRIPFTYQKSNGIFLSDPPLALRTYTGHGTEKYQCIPYEPYLTYRL